MDEKRETLPQPPLQFFVMIRVGAYKYLLDDCGRTPTDAIKYSFNEFLGGGNLKVATVANCQVCVCAPAELLDGANVSLE